MVHADSALSLFVFDQKRRQIDPSEDFQFRTGSSSSGAETKLFGGDTAPASSASMPSSPATTSKTSFEETRRTGDNRHKQGTSSESSSVWYVENQVDLTMKPPELSSLPMMTPSGLQHTVLSALAQSDPTPIFESSFVQSGQSKQESRKTQPMGTFEYCVKPSDTLERIAAHHDVTPSELQKLNRLTSRMVFTGQILYIPDPNFVPSGPPTPESVISSSSLADFRPKLPYQFEPLDPADIQFKTDQQHQIKKSVVWTIQTGKFYG
ncbi:hypothetical protein C0Q70_07913 [Pomacea canaliculata]|uniref:LysM domain-containing protein n=1 Tax=Pomacea canaliculata TaxID=400727 RepID=A0A2T7PGD9_POMCA|nr:hypothetical protein C0Q70_07913 [Pomacea canaliculata]